MRGDVELFTCRWLLTIRADFLKYKTWLEETEFIWYIKTQGSSFSTNFLFQYSSMYNFLIEIMDM